MSGSAASIFLEMVVLPAPEGEERTNNTPRRFRWTLSAMAANCARDGGGQAGRVRMVRGISRRGWLVAAGVMLLLTAILLALGRPALCPLGTISLGPGPVPPTGTAASRRGKGG